MYEYRHSLCKSCINFNQKKSYCKEFNEKINYFIFDCSEYKIIIDNFGAIIC